MTYYIIGLMSGSSLDGLDIVHTAITYATGKWEFELLHSSYIPYSSDWKEKLKEANQMTVPNFLKLNTAFGRYCGAQINEFIQKNDLKHKIHFIASHGHTVFHDPREKTTTQIGDGATIAAVTGYSTISDLRNMDIALGGQGAPIVPIADKLLFSKYDFCLNLGGISNITVNSEKTLAFDICPVNQILNFFAIKKGLEYDHDGTLAATGKINKEILNLLNNLNYYEIAAPKSLDNTFSETEIIPQLISISVADALSTTVSHIAFQIAKAIAPYCKEQKEYQMLVTGGGAMNKFLIKQIEKELEHSTLSVTCILPEENIINFKEAIAMALIGALRWREEENILSSVTGASRNSIGGAFWMGT